MYRVELVTYISQTGRQCFPACFCHPIVGNSDVSLKERQKRLMGFDPLMSNSVTLCSQQGHQRVCDALSLWDNANKRSLATLQKE